MAGADEISWARRVKQETIRRLYTLDAKGVFDDELVDEVGYAILARCESIRTVTRAHAGLATCPRCRGVIEHEWAKERALVCGCGWQTTWGEYLRTYQGKQLHGGKAYPMFRAFIDHWPAARSYREKMLVIDALIHACHGEFKGSMGRPAACNVIEGTMKELAAFLDELAYGPKGTPGVAERHEEWTRQRKAAWWTRIAEAHSAGVEE
jgi:hypothetical protein